MPFLGPFLDHPDRRRSLSLPEGHVGHFHSSCDRQRLYLCSEPGGEIEVAKVDSDSRLALWFMLWFSHEARDKATLISLSDQWACMSIATAAGLI